MEKCRCFHYLHLLRRVIFQPSQCQILLGSFSLAVSCTAFNTVPLLIPGFPSPFISAEGYILYLVIWSTP